jgi:hypothetical protein
MARPQTTLQRFWAHVAKTDTCWLWTGATRSGGYGVFRDGARSVSAHRFVWELQHGPIPIEAVDGQPAGKTWQVSSRCGNRRCVNPAHLQLVPPTQTVSRAVALHPIALIEAWEDPYSQRGQRRQMLLKTLTELRGDLAAHRTQLLDLRAERASHSESYRTHAIALLAQGKELQRQIAQACVEMRVRVNGWRSDGEQRSSVAS